MPATLRDMIVLNPLAPIFELARKWVIDPTAPGAGRARRRLRSAAAGARRSSSATASLAVWVFNREAPRIAEEL